MEFITYGSDHEDITGCNQETNTNFPIVEMYRSFGRQSNLSKRVHCRLLQKVLNIDETSVLIDSSVAGLGKIGSYTMIEHCYLANLRISIGSSRLLSGLRGNLSFSSNFTSIPNDFCIQQIKTTNNNEYVFVATSVHENIKDICTVFCGHDLGDLFIKLDLCNDDFWFYSKNKVKNIWNARIFPVLAIDMRNSIDLECLYWLFWSMENSCLNISTPEEVIKSVTLWKQTKKISLSELGSCCIAKDEFSFRQALSREISEQKKSDLEHIRHVLERRINNAIDFYPITNMFLHINSEDILDLFHVLDDILLKAVSDKNFDIASRVSMNIPVLLDEIILCRVNITNQDLCKKINLDFDSATYILNQVHINYSEFRKFRKEVDRIFKKISRSEHTISLCAKYISEFEALSARFTKLCVFSGFQLPIDNHAVDRSKHNIGWVFASAPARIDIAGGWTDTPPIGYEYGGAVTCLAVEVDSLRPLSACCRSTSRGCTLTTEERSLSDGAIIAKTTLKIVTVQKLLDFNDPCSDAALLKASIVFIAMMIRSEVIENMPEDAPIEEFFLKCFEHSDGIELVSTSLLPRGSGLGSSSNLGGCVITV